MGVHEVDLEVEDVRASVEADLSEEIRDLLSRKGLRLAVSLAVGPSAELVFVDPGLPELLAEEEMTAGMAAFRKNVTGVDNTIFVSAKFPRHVARIKVAVNPPTHIDRFGDNASVAIADGSVLAGELPPKVLKQVRQFLDLNQEALLAYWEQQIDDDELRSRLRKI